MAKDTGSSRSGSQEDNPLPPLATEAQQEKKPENFSVGSAGPPADPTKTGKMEALEGKDITKPPDRPKVTTKTGESSAGARGSKALSRAQMEQIIKDGGSVMYHDANAHGGARVISRLADLPTDLELAGDDPDKKAAAHKAIDDQIAKLQDLKKGIK